jgi:hypothetical protein
VRPAPRSRTRHVVVAAAALACLVAACSDEPGSDRAGGSGPDHETPAVGFTVGWVPNGFDGRLLVAPTDEPVTSDDSGQTVEPYVVLEPDGWSGHLDQLVVVNALDGTQAEGGLVQAGLVDGVASRVVAGRETWRMPDGADIGSLRIPRQVVARTDGEHGVRVHSVAAPMKVLDQLAAAVTLRDGQPVVRAPTGWSILSAITARQLGNLGVQSHPVSLHMGFAGAWGSRGGLSVRWHRGRVQLEVAVIEGSTDDLPAAGLFRRANLGSALGGRSAVERDGDEWWTERQPSTSTEDRDSFRELVTTAPNGTLLYVGVARPDAGALPSRSEIRRIARSVEIDAEAWDAAMDAQRTRPPKPDAGHAVVTRGRVGGVEWLLQDRRPGESGEISSDTPGFARVAQSLKLSGGRMLLSSTASSSLTNDAFVLDRLGEIGTFGGRPPFTALLVTVGPGVASISIGDGGQRHPVSPAPGGGAVVVTPIPEMSHAAIVRYDAAGNRLP